MEFQCHFLYWCQHRLVVFEFLPRGGLLLGVSMSHQWLASHITVLYEECDEWVPARCDVVTRVIRWLANNFMVDRSMNAAGL